MTSDKTRSLLRMIATARAGNVALNGGLLKALQRQLTGIHEEVEALEAAQVPPAMHVTADLIASGKVIPVAFERPFR